MVQIIVNKLLFQKILGLLDIMVEILRVYQCNPGHHTEPGKPWITTQL